MARLILLILLAASGLLAQAPRAYFAWWDSPLVRDLNLSPAQQRQIRQTVREYRGKLVDIRAAMEKAELDVEEAFDENTLDQRRAGDAIDRLANSRAELTRELSQMFLRLRMVLTPEQWQELQKRAPRRLQNGARPRVLKAK